MYYNLVIWRRLHDFQPFAICFSIFWMVHRFVRTVLVVIV